MTKVTLGQSKKKCAIIGKARVRISRFMFFSRTQEAILFRYKFSVYAMNDEGAVIGKVIQENPVPGGRYWLSSNRLDKPSSGLKADIEKEFRKLLREKKASIDRFKEHRWI